jgi:hypothetical protein
MEVGMKRRTYIFGAMSVPVVVTAGYIPSTEAANTSIAVEQVTQNSPTMMSIDDFNMAGFEWRWDFVLKRSSDGTFSATATQYDKWPEEDEEPWELEPHQSLQNGREICSAVRYMVEECGYHALDCLEPIAEKLESYDPRLAAEFRTEVSDLAEEMGWDE